MKGRGWVFEFFRCSDDFILQKFHLLGLMPVCVGLIMASCLFLSGPPITSGVQWARKVYAAAAEK